MKLRGFEDRNCFINMTDLDAIRIIRNGDQWDLAVFLCSSEKGERSYPMYRSNDYSEVARHRDLLLEEFPDVKVLS